MGYESRIFIVNRFEYTTPNGDVGVCAQEIAQFDLCKMGLEYNREFYNAFKTEIDYSLLLPGCDENGNETLTEQTEDCYGDHMKSADIDEIISALEIAEQREHYRRIPPLLAMLKAFSAAKDEWDWLEVVHYGY